MLFAERQLEFAGEFGLFGGLSRGSGQFGLELIDPGGRDLELPVQFARSFRMFAGLGLDDRELGRELGVAGVGSRRA